MIFRKVRGWWLLSALCVSLAATAQQKEAPAGWHLLDKQTDGYHGISLKQAYELLQGRKGQTVIVGVLDGGTDTTHEDLKPVLWRNPKEIPGNRRDDDGNGYADDVFGWNFLGGRDGRNVEKENLEAVRVYHDLKSDFEWINVDAQQLSEAQRKKFAMWQKVNKALELSPEDKFNLRMVQATARSAAQYDTILQQSMQQQEFSIDMLERHQPATTEARRAKYQFLRFTQLFQFEPDKTNKDIFEELQEYIDKQESIANAKATPLYDYRVIVGDNHLDINDRLYGNADVMGASSMHGTHVSGIIGAVRNNGIGMDGVADNVKLMTVRVVPKGDEYDKDVALGIRYAVDHGAKVINMSFGKDVSPQRHWVEDAIRYAAERDVLLVHAAGNESLNLDEDEHFPTARLSDGSIAANMITVGASGDSSIAGGMVTPFTNYGRQTVDVLAPGIRIYSTVPGTQGYAFQQGTSMAAPVVSGIAALLRSYFPQLTAAEVKDILMQSADTSLRDQRFTKPGGDKEKIAMSDVSRTGGIVNARNAVMLAIERMSRNK